MPNCFSSIQYLLEKQDNVKESMRDNLQVNYRFG